MVHLDPVTLLVLLAIVALVAAVLVVVDSSLRGVEALGRLWGMAYLSAAFFSVTLLVDTLTHADAAAVAAGTAVLAVGFAWAGIRWRNRKQPRSWIGVGAAALTAAVGPLADAAGTDALVIGFAPVGVLSLLYAYEALSGSVRRRLHAQVLAALFGLLALYGAAVLVAELVLGTAQPWLADPGPVALVAVVVTMLSAVSSSALIAEADRHRPVQGADQEIDAIPEESPQTQRAAAALLERADFLQEGVCLIEAQLDNLGDMNLAFGRRFGDDAIVRFGEILRRHLPAFSVIVYRRAGRFSILVDAESDDWAQAMVENVQLALAEEPMGRPEGIRYITASFGIAHSDRFGYSLAALQVGADAACRRAVSRGGNLALSASQA